MNPNDTTNDAPKLCECGCGQPAPIATRTDARFGHVKGQPMRFILGHASRLQPIRPLEERFWDKVQKTDGCWLWAGAATNDGYGVLRSGPEPSKIIRAHCLSYEIHFGPIPAGNDICHQCDNPPCVRPDHLFAGTAHDNTADMMAKGRHNRTPENSARGERHGMAKLTEVQVLAIRAEYAAGKTSHRKLAAKYGVSEREILFILHRHHWTHI